MMKVQDGPSMGRRNVIHPVGRHLEKFKKTIREQGYVTDDGHAGRSVDQ